MSRLISSVKNNSSFKSVLFVILSVILSVAFVTQRANATVPGINAAIGISIGGSEPNYQSELNNSAGSEISQDGRYVVFTSNATDIIASPTPNGKNRYTYATDSPTLQF